VARGQAIKQETARFEEPPWGAPFEKAEEILAIPETAEMAGMFLAPLVITAKRRGVVLPSARERYLPFKFYPLREHASLLIESCELLLPDVPIRLALRKLGRGAPAALIASTLGKVVLGSAQGVHAVVEAMVKAYPLNVRPSQTSILSSGPTEMIVRFDEVHYFLDSHHVGALEGALKHAGANGRVLIHSRSRSSADFLVEWGELTGR
jgi:uncharacterized protein (TIGR02265 family)